MKPARTTFLATIGLAALVLRPGPAATRPAGPPLDAPRALPSPAAPGSVEPFLSVSPEGALWMSWLEPRAGGGHALKVARLNGSRWTAPLTAAEGDSFFVNWADGPSVAALRSNALAVNWIWRTGPDPWSYDVRVAFSGDAGHTWGKPICPHRVGTGTEHGFASLLREGDGVRVTWLDGRRHQTPADSGASAPPPDSEPEPDMVMMTAVAHPDGEVTDDALLDGLICDCCQPVMVKIPLGVLVAYRDHSANDERDITVMGWQEGTWTGQDRVYYDEWKLTACPVSGPGMAAAGDRVAIAWYTAARDTPRVRLAFSNNRGRLFQGTFVVDEGDPIGRVSVQMLEDGSALVAWLEAHEKGARILARRVAPDGTRSLAVTIAETSAAPASGLPRMALEGRRAIFAWTEVGEPPKLHVAEAAVRGR